MFTSFPTRFARKGTVLTKFRDIFLETHHFQFCCPWRVVVVAFPLVALPFDYLRFSHFSGVANNMRIGTIASDVFRGVFQVCLGLCGTHFQSRPLNIYMFIRAGTKSDGSSILMLPDISRVNRNFRSIDVCS